MRNAAPRVSLRDEGLVQIVAPDGTSDRALDPQIDPELVRRIYAEMVRIRLLDERMMILQRQGRIGFYGACTGQEAAILATAAALEDRDWVFPALREGAVMLWRGFPLDTYLCQVFGNSGDVLKGRQMPSHYSSRTVNQISWSSCIGSQIPQAVGAAMAMKRARDGAVAVGFMGDGATSSADFHNAINFAGVYKAPALLICQNNHWSISVPTARQTASQTIAIKARAYGIPGVRADGNDALAVYQVVKEAADRARAGKGATFIELVTYRIGAHSSSDDPRVYRDENEVEEWKRRDPLERLRRYLEARRLWDTSRELSLRERLTQEIGAALQQAESLPPPPVESIFDDVYAERPWHLEEQREDFLALDPSERSVPHP